MPVHWTSDEHKTNKTTPAPLARHNGLAGCHNASLVSLVTNVFAMAKLIPVVFVAVLFIGCAEEKVGCGESGERTGEGAEGTGERVSSVVDIDRVSYNADVASSDRAVAKRPGRARLAEIGAKGGNT